MFIVKRAEPLARSFGCAWGPWPDRLAVRADLYVNCTSIGMSPETDASPMPIEAIPEGSAVFDTVYNPAKTMWLREAEARGCLCIDGVGMFARQAEAQFRIWTGFDAPADLFRDAAAEALSTA